MRFLRRTSIFLLLTFAGLLVQSLGSPSFAQCPNPEEFDVVGGTILMRTVELEMAGRIEDAIDQITAAIANEPQSLCNLARLSQFEHVLASLLAYVGRHAQAEGHFRRALEIAAQAQDAVGEQRDYIRRDLAKTLLELQRPEEAVPLLEELLKTLQSRPRREIGTEADVEGDIARVYVSRGDWASAAGAWSRAVRHSLENFRQALSFNAQIIDSANAYIGLEIDRRLYAGYIDALWQVGGGGSIPRRADFAASFEAMQWASISRAAHAISQLNARVGARDAELAALIHERQALQQQFRAGAASKTPDHDRQREIDRRLLAIDRTISRAFPRYDESARPGPADLKNLQSVLRQSEAFILFGAFTRERTGQDRIYAWVVTADNTVWVKLPVNVTDVTRDVETVRCGVDWALWRATDRCSELTGGNRQQIASDQRLPFRADAARRLYTGLFEPIKQYIDGKQLVIAPGDLFSFLPFHALITRGDGTLLDGASGRITNWLVREHAISMVPTVGSFLALRTSLKPSSANEAYVGFGNPLLDGRPGTEPNAAASARARGSCADVFRLRDVDRTTRAVIDPLSPLAERGAIADRTALLRQHPLPETADEICSVAFSLGSIDAHLGAAASESAVKALSDSGKLRAYRIVHFATHAAVAGRLAGTVEPGLILTPPDRATTLDDGYLSAGEIAGLDMDAEWTILSACNTAAPSATDSEALTGLAYAFFIAGSRSILVSNWAVESLAAVDLIENSIQELMRNPAAGRAEALRKAMIAVMESRDAMAMPETWAPFVLVGDSGMR